MDIITFFKSYHLLETLPKLDTVRCYLLNPPSLQWRPARTTSAFIPAEDWPKLGPQKGALLFPGCCLRLSHPARSSPSDPCPPHTETWNLMPLPVNRGWRGLQLAYKQ